MSNSYEQDENFGVGKLLVGAGFMFFLLVAGAGGWAATAKLNAAVIGRGLVKVDRELKTVQHIDGGTVLEILAQPGQRLEQGDVMVSLDMLNLEGELAVRRAQLIDLTARSSRLQAQRDNQENLITLTEFTSDAKAMAVMLDEASLHASTRRDIATRQAGLASRISQLQHEADGLEARQTALESQYALAESVLTRTSQLAQKGSISVVQKETAVADQARVWGDLLETRARLLGNAAQVTEMELEARRLGETAQLEAQAGLREINPRIEELKQQITLLEAQIERSKIRAPVAGIVNELMVNTVGQVIAPGEQLATIVPAGADLVIEFQVAPTDIDEVRVGQQARLLFAAFNQKTTPEIPGTVLHVAAAATIDPTTGAPIFLAQVMPSSGVQLPEHINLVPGMPVDVFITTQERTAMDYLIDPVRRSFARSMKEE